MLDTGNTTPENVKGKPLPDVVAERIERLIIDGILKVGDVLPSERRLCEKLGASRSVLREGLRLLRGRGIIETEHGKGSYIARLAGETDTSPLSYLMESQSRTLYDLLEVRAILESEAARLAALRATSADVVLIRRRFDELKDKQESPTDAALEEHARVDHGFHRSINDASHNPVLVHTLESLSDLMLRSVFASVANLYHRPAFKRIIDRQHERLFDAVTGRDPERAERIAKEHIHALRDMFMEIEQEELRLSTAVMRLEGWKRGDGEG